MAISVGDAVVKLGLDKTQYEQGMRSVANETEAGMGRMKKASLLAGAAITAIGIAGLKLVADARKMNAALAQVAITTGHTTAEMRQWALELSNVTFRIGSVISVLEILAQAGVTNEEQLKANANAFDALGDAIGSNAETVASTLIPAYKFFGLELPQTAEDLDRLTWLSKKAMVNFSSLGEIMGYVAAYGDELDLTLEDLVSILAILAERGVTGSAVTKKFRTAITQAVNEGKSLNETLGISNAVLDEYNQKIGVEAVGMTQAYADAANQQHGIMDKLAADWEKVSLAIGSVLTPLEPVFGLFSAMGPLLMALSLTTLPQLIANLKASAIALIGYAAAAAKAVAHNIALAASKIWAWASAIPVAGIALAIGGVAALTASIILARRKANEAIAGLAEGGIIRRPTMALVGEAGPEAVIPLSKAGSIPGSGELHLHFQIGNYMGDEMSMRQLVRRIDQMLKEESRRSQFGQVNQGWFWGRSAP